MKAIETAYLDLTDYRGGEPPPPDAWELAIKKRYVAEYAQGEILLEQLSITVDDYQDTIEKLRELKAGKNDEKPPRRDDHRASALSRLFAIEASSRDEIVGFRHEILEGSTLAIDDVEQWIIDRSLKEGEPTEWVTLPVKDDGTLDWPLPPGQYIESSSILYYIIDQEGSRRLVPIRSGEILDRLKKLADHLSKIYGWEEAWASTFVLTNQVPPVSDLHYRINQPWPWWKARRSITITAPLWVTSRHVTDLFNELRHMALRGDVSPRAVSKKKADLAVFATLNRQGRTWSETMDLWNEANSEWGYNDEARFTRDCREAFKRITGKDLHWEGKE